MLVARFASLRTLTRCLMSPKEGYEQRASSSAAITGQIARRLLMKQGYSLRLSYQGSCS
jgi:hypothetical protein